MNREELIEELHRLCDETDVETSEATQGWLVGNIRAALARFEKAQAPTAQDEREAADALAEYDRSQPSDYERAYADPLAGALRALLRRPAQTEPPTIQFAARRIGKSQALIDSMLTQANERGIRVEVVYPQSEPTDAERETLIDVMVMTRLSDYATTDVSAIRQAVDAILAAGFRRPTQPEPTDAQVKAAIQGRYAAFRRNVNATETHLMRAALEAAFTAGQEEAK